MRSGTSRGSSVRPSVARNTGLSRRWLLLQYRIRESLPAFLWRLRYRAGITARDLIDEHCGGMADGHTFKGYLPGGASGGILPAAMADIPLDFGTLDEYGCFVGSHAVMVFSDKDDIRDVAVNVLRFFEDESCGQCTPCRVGCEKAVKLMENGQWDPSLLRELGDAMRDASICGLGQAAPNPLFSVLDRFAEDLR